MWAHPFVGVGYAPRIVHGTDVSSGSFLSGETTNPPVDVYTNQRSVTHFPVTQGLVVSGGLDFSAGHLQFSPELRYVHWDRPFLDQLGGDGNPGLHSTQNEMFVPLGIAWP